MKLKAMVSLAGLAVAAAGCGNLADPHVPTAYGRYVSDGTLVVFADSFIDTYGPDLAQTKVHIPIHGAPEPVFSASDDGRVAAVGSQAGDVVQMFDLSSGKRTSTFHLGQSSSGGIFVPVQLTLSPTGDLLFVGAADTGLPGDVNGWAGRMFETSTGKLLWPGTTPLTPWPPLFSPDESTLYLLPADGPLVGNSVLGMDSQTGAMKVNLPVVNHVQALGGMADPNTLIAETDTINPVSYATASTEIDLLSTADGSITGQVLLPTTSTFSGGFQCAPAVGLCVMGADPNRPNGGPLTQVWSLDGTLVQGINDSGYLAISPDGQYVAVSYGGIVVAVYAVSDGSQVKFLDYSSELL